MFVKFAGVVVPKAPFAVNIEGTPGDPKKCVAFGPGIEPKGRPAGKLTYFDVTTKGTSVCLFSSSYEAIYLTNLTVSGQRVMVTEYKFSRYSWIYLLNEYFHELAFSGAGFGQLECVITDPDGKTANVPMKLVKVADNQYKCEYCPVKPGPHTVQVLFAGKPIPKAPFKVNVGNR